MKTHAIAVSLTCLLLAPQAGSHHPVPEDMSPGGEMGTHSVTELIVPDAPPPEPDPDESAVDQAAQVFVQALIGRKAKELAKAGSDPFSFEGRTVEGVEAIERYWTEMLAKAGEKLGEQDSGRLTVLTYKETVERFGEPPKKLASLKLKRCRFVVVEFNRRPGMLLILCPQGKHQWKVCGATD
ncbi:MAG: hypothetical protein JXR96_20005 [Deltaproteobacteria bacterium]|nr:hypothetical protein [Deltaproteobacteria bacterium]